MLCINRHFIRGNISKLAQCACLEFQHKLCTMVIVKKHSEEEHGQKIMKEVRLLSFELYKMQV